MTQPTSFTIGGITATRDAAQGHQDFELHSDLNSDPCCNYLGVVRKGRGYSAMYDSDDLWVLADADTLRTLAKIVERIDGMEMP